MITKRLNSIENLTDAEKAAHELLKLESFAKEKINDLRGQFVVDKSPWIFNHKESQGQLACSPGRTEKNG